MDKGGGGVRPRAKPSSQNKGKESWWGKATHDKDKI